MAEMLEALWTTIPLTTPDTVITRSRQTGQLVSLMRAGGDEWANLSDEQRRAAACRLLFMRQRMNGDDRLRHRVAREPEGEPMRAIALDLIVIAAVLASAVHVVARRLWRKRP